MINNLDGYEDLELTSYDANIIRNSVSEDIILDRMYDDINNILSDKLNDKKVNYLNEIINKYKILKNIYSENYEICSDLDDAFFDILENVEKNIEEVFDFSLEFNILLNKETRIDYIYSLYLFFILNLKDTIYNFLINYITFNIDELKKICKVNKNKNNIIIQNYKKILQPDYIGLVYNINNILNTLECNNINIFERCIESDPALMENYFIQKIFLDEENVDVGFEEKLIEKFKIIIKNNSTEFESLIEKYLIDNYKL